MHMHRKWNLSFEGRSNFHILLKKYWVVLFGWVFRIIHWKLELQGFLIILQKNPQLRGSVLKHWCEIPVVSA